jgi:polyphosphate kinase
MAKEEMFIGSADWMYRNLSRRVEVLVPIKDPRLRQFLRDTVLNSYLKDNVNARELRADGTYVRVKQLKAKRDLMPNLSLRTGLSASSQSHCHTECTQIST